MTYLLDTNVISAIAPSATVRSAHLDGWLEQHSGDLFLSVVTVAEIRDRIAKAKREGASRKASMLATWWDAIERLYGSRLLPLDVASARCAGALRDRARMRGIAPGFADVAIAAIAQSRGLIIVTRNMRHFSVFGLPLLDPFQDLPSR